MGRGCTMDEWAHFQKLPEEGRVPNSSYWYVMCRHCMLAYEQKQLQNAPAKITGRRSAMHAHLKACPIYGAEYNMEQQAKAEVDAQEAEDTATDLTDASTTTTTGKKRKRRSSGLRGGRGKHCMMEEWEHFNRLQEDGYIGKSNFFHAICRYCQQAYDEASEDQKPLLVPEKLVGRREKLRKHLVHCSNFKGELPSLERQIRHRIGDIPHSAVISTLAAKVTAETGTVDGMVDPAVGVVVAQTNTAAGSTGSTRMMLDEWQYFTRMERKKDSAYYHARCNFCQQAYENAPESLKASMEPPYVTGRKSNMQTHLAKCPHIPQELVSTKTYNAGLNHSSETEAATTPPDAIVPLAAKRINQDAPQTLQAASPDGSTVHRALVELLLEHHLPFDWVESASAKKLFCALVPMPTVANALMPSTIGLRTYILDEIHNATLASELTKLQELVPLELAASAFSACVTNALGALFVAADGIITVQLALEVVWAQLEQPLFVLAHALDPRLRLRNLGSTEITKLSALSDVSVAYFISLFGRKPSSLRGEVTAYLHTSQRAFTSDVISEFPVVDDYFRYLSDNHPSLAMLMQVLHSFSPVSTAKHSVQEGAMKTAADNYTREEQQKLEYLRDRWGLAPTLETDGGDETKGRIAAHNSRSGAALLNAGVVVDEWKEALEAKLHMRGVDFALLDDKFDGIDDVDIVSDYSEQDAMNRVASAHGPKLPSLALDDKMTFPSASLREPFSKKVLLKDLFKTVEATI
ncbi:hypothetical protein G195_003632 [Phytophthora kernoviae 00238/432]|uniref:BED-type domain-containing protein n=1 Tax=Phytophthora kernoviae 00238/432 TaxID=1284355 RepID=A0A8J4S9V1_9STRA|nr:hypothetical protein G195_003632 [Phytophthora kernoviae 00238/432]